MNFATIDSDPGDEDLRTAHERLCDEEAEAQHKLLAAEDPTQARDREIVEAETQERRQKLFELAHAVDTDSAREDAIDALETVKRAHEAPSGPVWPL